MAAASLPDTLLKQIEAACDPGRIFTDPADCLPYGYDNSRQQRVPDVVVQAETHAEVSAVLRLCNQYDIPVTARGAGTGTTGATVPIHGGLVLSLERMNRIIEVDPDNRLLRAEPGVSNQAVQEAAGEYGFFWAPDPTSARVCTIGGNLAYNSAGPRAVKYGTPRDNTLGLRAVTAAGEELRTGVYTTKGVVGYDLTRLLIGSEGTLAVITEATLKLLPKPAGKRTLRAVYDDMVSAAAAVSRIMAQPETPCALEFIDGAAIDMIREYATSGLPDNAGAMLMIEVDGAENQLTDAAGRVSDAARGAGLTELSVAANQEESRELWETRKALSPALRNVAPKKINEDVVVPVSRMPELISGLRELSESSSIPIVNFGHAGNGNIHVNLLIDPDVPEQMENAESCLDAVFDLVLKLDGTLSGEHGVGLVKRDYVVRELDPVALKLMQEIKQVFDPKGILNPGKTLPA